MKKLINKLGMVAVVAALGVVGYLLVNHYSAKKTDNVIIQKSCIRSSDCGHHHHCARPKDPSAVWGICHKN